MSLLKFLLFFIVIWAHILLLHSFHINIGQHQPIKPSLVVKRKLLTACKSFGWPVHLLLKIKEFVRMELSS